MFRLKQMFFFALVIFSFSSLAATVFPVNQEILKLPVKDSLTGKYFDYSIQLHRTTPFYKVYKISFPAPVKGKALFGNVSGFYYVPIDLKEN